MAKSSKAGGLGLNSPKGANYGLANAGRKTSMPKSKSSAASPMGGKPSPAKTSGSTPSPFKKVDNEFGGRKGVRPVSSNKAFPAKRSPKAGA